MTRRLLTGNGAAAWGARLARVDYVPAFPITPIQANFSSALRTIVWMSPWIPAFNWSESLRTCATAAGDISMTMLKLWSNRCCTCCSFCCCSFLNASMSALSYNWCWSTLIDHSDMAR